VGIRCANHVTPLYPQKLALTSPTGGGRSVGIVRSRTKATELWSTVGFVCLFLVRQPPVDQCLIFHGVSRSHITTHHSRYDSSGRVISSSQRPLPDNTQHSQQKNIHAPGGIRNHDLRRRAAADLRLRSCGHWNCRVEKLNN